VWFWLVAAGCTQGTIRIRDTAVDTDVTDTDDTGLDTEEETDLLPTPDCAAYGVLGGASIFVDGNGRIDSFVPEFASEPRDFATVATNSTGPCAVSVESGRIGGDVWVGPDSYPDIVICKGRNGRVVGDQNPLSELVPLTEVPLPGDMPDNGGDKLIAQDDVQTFKVDRVFDDLVVREGATLRIDGEVRVLARSVTWEAGLLELAPGATFDLYVTGDLAIRVNSRWNISGNSGDVRVHLLGTATAEAASGAEVRAHLDGVDATLRVEGASWSGVAQARRISVIGGGSFRVDESALCP
jgi:hypothetical protein